ncbi:Uncharacterised protein [BD1-7 clade bacterium]|uniref:BIG2 domain-containing protein n=1 Tax=BD1-7 clade bacterium TaxID=2029982 RepID=A0A5S9P7S1_9GAMM|nr:Uncharacterised protein [BD1-7 clade bacterium]CAA0099471.1 Uncharacterised protein [BD1-7 clade bacterium]
MIATQLRIYALACMALLVAGCNESSTPANINDGSELSISLNEDSLIVGEKLQFSVLLTSPNGDTTNITQSVSVESHNAQVLKKDDNGQLVAMATGNAGISTTYRGLSASTTVEVSPHEVRSLFIDTPHIQLLPASSKQVQVLVYLSNHTNKPLFNVDWITESDNVASIDRQGIITANSSGTARFQASFGDFSTELIVDVPDEQNLASARLVFNTVDIQLPQEGSALIRSYLELSSGSVIDATDVTEWAADDPSIIKLSDADNQIKIQPLAPGQTTITASLKIGDHGFENQQNVTVSAAKLSHLIIAAESVQGGNDNIPEIPAGASLALSATAFYDDGQSLDVTHSVDWKASPQAPFQLINNGKNTGTIIGLHPGTAPVSITLNGQADEATLVVSDAEITDLSIDNKTPSTMLIGLPWQYKLNATFADGTHTDVTNQAAWFSSAPEVATINTYQDNPGLVAPLRKGTTEIEATFAGITATKHIDVTDAHITGIHLTPKDSIVLNTGDEITLTAKAALSDDSLLDITHAVSWYSTDSGIASVQSVYHNLPGTLHARSPGNTSVSAVLNYIGSKNLPITVANGEIIAVTIDPPTITIPLGSTYTFKALAEHKNGHKQDVAVDAEWQSDDASILEVLGEGTTKTHRLGDTQLRVNYKGFNHFADVRVADAEIDYLEIIGELPIHSGGKTKISNELSVRAFYTDGSYIDVDEGIQWATTNPIYIELENGDTALGIASGETEISATYAGVTGHGAVTVEPTPYSYTITEVETIGESFDTYYIATLAELENPSAFNGMRVQWDTYFRDDTNRLLANLGTLHTISGETTKVRLDPEFPKVNPNIKKTLHILPTCRRAYRVFSYDDDGWMKLHTLETGTDVTFSGFKDADFTWEHEDGKFVTSHMTMEHSAHTFIKLDLQGKLPPKANDVMSVRVPGCESS